MNRFFLKFQHIYFCQRVNNLFLHFFCRVFQIHGSKRNFLDRKSTRLNPSHANISYAAFCLKINHASPPPRPHLPPPPYLVLPLISLVFQLHFHFPPSLVPLAHIAVVPFFFLVTPSLSFLLS